VIESVEAFDSQNMDSVVFSNTQCEFSYRDSIFKSSQKSRYIITAINMKLSKSKPVIPNYPDVIEYFKNKNISKPNLHQIREAIIDIRTHKLPDPNKIPNAGSFFKNPIINTTQANELKQRYPEIRMFEMPDGMVKLFAGWLIEQAGLKGKKLTNVQVDPNHALVLENLGGASQKDLQRLIYVIQSEVKNKFGILLEPEPVIVQFNS
jgi:UDP-N-acetylmuramate dehydrogenase